MKATEELKNEHQGIQLMLRVLDQIASKAERKESIRQDHLSDILEFLTVFVDTCHHGKEEDFLFPALETAGVQRRNGPIGLLLEEHETGRSLVAKIRSAAPSLPLGSNAASESFLTAVRGYIDLLTKHIEKEDTILFPMAEEKLDAAVDAKLYESFEQLEHERIGEGKHEEFHRLLAMLEQEYLR
jgi:hemerythrin-like domain-containing protein